MFRVKRWCNNACNVFCYCTQRMTSAGETYCRVGSGGGGGGGGNAMAGGGGVVGVRGRHPTPAPRSVKSESEEYDTFGSDSDTDPPASSRTESSNQLDHDRSGPIRAVHHSKSPPPNCLHPSPSLTSGAAPDYYFTSLLFLGTSIYIQYIVHMKHWLHSHLHTPHAPLLNTLCAL